MLELASGTLVGPYRIDDLLGRGGMGVVYRATDLRLERRIALKVIVKGDTGGREDYEGRLLREARAVAALNHPNVVSIFDVGETPELLYFAMEYVDGENLRAKIGDARVPLGERIRWLADVALGLHAAHTAGVVHRDVKPENVMIRHDGLVKVLDFGIARRTRAIEAGQELITGDDHVIGTPLYMAPEQLRGEPLDARTDQFAWGVVAYELLAGVRPFAAPQEGYALVAAILSDPARPLRELVADLPAGVAATVHTALAKAPERRLPSMEHVAAELAQDATTGSSLSLRPAAPHTLVDVRRHEPAAFAETTRVPTTHDAPPTAAVAPVRSRRRWLALALLAALAAALFAARRPRPVARPPAPERALCPVPEAHAELKAARVHLRDGAESEALRELQRATELDDTCGAAHLELALKLVARDPQEGLRHYQSAFHARDTLGPRDLAVLEASEPFVRTRPDLVEWETRLTAAVYRYPKDPELRVWLGMARGRQYDLEGAKAAFEAATRLDPGYSPAWAGLAGVESRLGDRTAALGAVAACLARSPVASLCLGTRYELNAQAGECARARDDAMAWVALDPASADPQRALAGSLFAVEAPRPAIDAALRRRWSMLRPDAAKQVETTDRLDLAVADGRFDEALALAETLEPMLPADADLDDHAAVAMTRVTLLTETGRVKRAGEVAKEFRDRMLAYAPNHLLPDPSIGFMEPMFRAGLLSRADLEAQRSVWQAGEIARTRASDAAVLGQQRGRLSWLRWSLVHGAFAESREEAQSALRAIPQDSEPPLAQRSLRFDFAAGKVLALAGEHKHAVEHLTRVADACFGLWEPQLHVRAHYYLGLALEARGDRAAAAAAYRFVTDKWGAARPRSVTAEQAKARLLVLAPSARP